MYLCQKFIIWTTTNFKFVYNFAAKLSSFLTILFAIVLLTSCEEEKRNEYIIIKNGDGVVVTGDTVTVAINTVHQTLIEVVSHSTTPRYLRQLDFGNVEELKGTNDFEIISHGSNSEKAVITTSFSDTIVNVGSIVKITVRVDTKMVESVFYKVIW